MPRQQAREIIPSRFLVIERRQESFDVMPPEKRARAKSGSAQHHGDVPWRGQCRCDENQSETDAEADARTTRVQKTISQQRGQDEDESNRAFCQESQSTRERRQRTTSRGGVSVPASVAAVRGSSAAVTQRHNRLSMLSIRSR